jgi:hypothetical protein
MKSGPSKDMTPCGTVEAGRLTRLRAGRTRSRGSIHSKGTRFFSSP